MATGKCVKCGRFSKNLSSDGLGPSCRKFSEIRPKGTPNEVWFNQDPKELKKGDIETWDFPLDESAEFLREKIEIYFRRFKKEEDFKEFFRFKMGYSENECIIESKEANLKENAVRAFFFTLGSKHVPEFFLSAFDALQLEPVGFSEAPRNLYYDDGKLATEASCIVLKSTHEESHPDRLIYLYVQRLAPSSKRKNTTSAISVKLVYREIKEDGSIQDYHHPLKLIPDEEQQKRIEKYHPGIIKDGKARAEESSEFYLCGKNVDFNPECTESKKPTYFNEYNYKRLFYLAKDYFFADGKFCFNENPVNYVSDQYIETRNALLKDLNRDGVVDED